MCDCVKRRISEAITTMNSLNSASDQQFSVFGISKERKC